MAQIVLGLATSHSPLLTFGVETWLEKADDDKRRKLNLSDGRMVSYAQLEAERGTGYAHLVTHQHLENQRKKCHEALDRLADELAAAAPDVVIIVGDDQAELFSLANMPAVSIFYGERIVTHPWGEVDEHMPGWKAAAAKGYGMDTVHTYVGARDFSLALIEGLIAREVDIGAASEVIDPKVAGFGHAYGFIIERLFRGREIPVAPVLLNTYLVPNVPTASRCYDIGRNLNAIIDAMPAQTRVAVIASGGLSHFTTDEVLDRGVLEALRNKNATHLRAVPAAALKSGSSEILNWILAAGVLEHLPLAWMEYLPIYRTPAGTGIGMGFAAWRG